MLRSLLTVAALLSATIPPEKVTPITYTRMDVSGDGIADDIRLSHGDHYVHLAIALGAERTIQELTIAPYEEGTYQLVFTDLDTDGDLDMILTHASSTDTAKEENILRGPPSHAIIYTPRYLLWENKKGYFLPSDAFYPQQEFRGNYPIKKTV